MNISPKCSVRTNGALLAALSILATPASYAVDWIGTEGAFSDAANWTGDVVPGPSDIAAILNEGTAEISDLDSFSVQRLVLGGHSGTGSLNISNGTLMVNYTGGDPKHNAYIGGDDGAGGTGVGTLNILGGTLAASGGEFLVGSRGGTGTLNMEGGTLTNNNWIIIGRDAGGTGNAVLSGNATIDKTGSGNIAIAVFTGGTSTVTMSDDSFMSSNNEIRVGWGNNSAATTAVLNMSGNAGVSAGGTIHVGMREGGGTAGPTGEMHMSGASNATAGNEFYVGSGEAATATLTMDDTSKITVTNGFVVGRFNSAGTATVNGGAEIAIGGVNVVGDGGASTATLVLNGGSVHSEKQLWLGLNQSSSTVTINGGLLQANAILDGGDLNDPTGAGVSFSRFGAGGNGTLNLNGGVLETPGFSKYGGTALINFNGGTLRATGNTTGDSFFDGFASGDIAIQSGGLHFDTNSNTILITQDLSGEGGLTKIGDGALVLLGINSYLGNTIIQGGTLSITTGFLADNSTVSLDLGTVFDLNFAGTDTIGALFINGEAQALGTWGAIGSSAEHQTNLISGDGILLVTVPEPSTIALLVGGFALAGFVRRRARRA